MSFVKVKSGRIVLSNNKDAVRISYPYLRRSAKEIGHNLVVCVGKYIADKIGIHEGDRVDFHTDDKNPRLLLIKKTESADGYKVLPVKRKDGKSPNYYRIQRSWKVFQPKDDEIASHCVLFDIYDGGIRIYPNK